MTLQETIQNDLQQALKNREAEKLSVLRLLWDSVIKKQKQKQEDLEDAEVMELISSSVKKNKDAIEQFKNGGRDDLVKKTEKEIEILKIYLPEQMSEQEVAAIVEKAVKEADDFGKVMSIVMPQVKGKADGALVSRLVKEKLC